MAKAKKTKKKAAKKRANKYEEKLRINGSFQDLINELIPPAKKEEKKKD